MVLFFPSCTCALVISVALAVPRILSSFAQDAFTFAAEEGPKCTEVHGNRSLKYL